MTLFADCGANIGTITFDATLHQMSTSSGFAGLESSMPFTRALLNFNTPGNPSDIGELFFFDNLRIHPVDFSENMSGDFDNDIDMDELDFLVTAVVQAGETEPAWYD